MNTFVIGSSGFLGNHLKLKFYEFGTVEIAPSFTLAKRKGFDEWMENLISKMLAFSPDLVILAGASQSSNDDPEAIKEIIFSNCLIPCRIAEAMISHLPKSYLVSFGSSWQYADSETYRPFNLYAASKQASLDLLEHYSLRGLHILYLILFDTYGEGDSRKKLLNILIDAALNGTQIDTTYGEQEIDLVHINDICQGVVNAINELHDWDPMKGVLVRGLGSGNPITIKELINRVSQKYCTSIKANIGGRPYRSREIMKTYKKFIKPKNWFPKINEYNKELEMKNLGFENEAPKS